jgi:hypothetical protein
MYPAAKQLSLKASGFKQLAELKRRVDRAVRPLAAVRA